MSDSATDGPRLVYRDPDGRQLIVVLHDRQSATVGRADTRNVCLSWDGRVSHLHAKLERLDDEWVLIDDGLSRNGSFVNGERLRGRHRLRDGDELGFGSTVVAFRAAGEEPAGTQTGLPKAREVQLSDAQRRVLVELCRPFGNPTPYTVPAGNQEIAERLVLAVDTVKTHMRVLFDKLAVEDLPAHDKRLQLVRLALEGGHVTRRELS